MFCPVRRHRTVGLGDTYNLVATRPGTTAQCGLGYAVSHVALEIHVSLS